MTDLIVEGDENITILTKSSAGLKIKAVFADGHSENVSSVAEITVDNPDVVQVVRGRIFALEDGQALLNVTYTDSKGKKLYKNLKVTSSTFPLTSQLLNPSIYAQGSFNETTRTLITGQWGFGGWWYTNGLDLSGYKYLVARLGADNKSSISFRVFDENNYWSGAAEYNFGTKRQVVVSLNNMVKAGKTTKLDPSHIYIVGFWSSGNSPIVIDSVFLSNSSEYRPVGIDHVLNSETEEPAEVDVYNMMGLKIRSPVKREVATEGLRNGVYFVGRKKVMVYKNY